MQQAKVNKSEKYNLCYHEVEILWLVLVLVWVRLKARCYCRENIMLELSRYSIILNGVPG